MAEAIPPLTVDIIFNTSGVSAGVTKATEGLNKITAQAKTVTTSMGHLKSTMLAVFGGNIATQGFFMLEKALMESKQEFFDTEAATKRLGQALDNMGVKSEATRESILKNVEAYSQLGFQGPESANAMGTLITATGSVEQSTKLMAMAADLARYKHIDLGTAATILARGTQGSAKAFKELGITLDTTIPKNQAISKAFDQLNTKIGGQAVAYTKTFEGQMKVLKERLQETFNAIATYVLPALTKFFGLINAGISWIQQNASALKVLAGLLVVVTANLWLAAAAEMALTVLGNPFVWIAAGAVALAGIFVYLWNHWKTFRDSMAEGLATITQLIGYLTGAVAKLIRAMSYLPKMGFLKKVADDADKAAISLGKVAKNIDELKNKKITAPKMPTLPTGSVKPGSPTNIAGNVPGGDKLGGGGGGGSGVVQNILVYASNTNDIAKKMALAAKVGSPIGTK